jgi:hypothetical protein
MRLLITAILTGLILANEETIETTNPSLESSSENHEPKKQITVLGLDEVLQQSGDHNPRLNYEEIHANDLIEDSFFDPFALDSSCIGDEADDASDDCWHPPSSTVEEELVEVSEEDGISSGFKDIIGVDNMSDDEDAEEECNVDNDTDENIDETQCKAKEENTNDASASSTSQKHTVLIDKHWGSDPNILRMRDRLRGTRSRYWDMIQEQDELIRESNISDAANHTGQSGKPSKAKSLPHSKQSTRRPPVFLLPGLASTRLVSWKHKPCPQSALLSDIKMLDYVWLNMNLLIQMATIDVRCWSECMTLAKFQRDYDEDDEWVNGTDAQSNSHWCKLRPDEGLDAISSLAPGSISSSFLVGGTNTV